MRIAVVLSAAALAAVGCSSGSAGLSAKPRSATTSLGISVWTRGPHGPVRTWTLSCPSGGTLPKAARACRRLDALERPFAPIPDNVACTALYGGPAVAEVRGRFQGRRFVARFERSNGCEIDRWNRVAFLFPIRT